MSMTRRSFVTAGATVLGGAVAGLGGIAYAFQRINSVGEYAGDRIQALYAGQSNALFERFPGLVGRLPWRPLGDFPTPVEALRTPAGMTAGRLFVKRDDLTSRLYGGNKVRKLEHVLAEAELRGAQALVTMGGIGSNQSLATALHGGALGFGVDVSLFDHPVSEHAKANLLGDIAAGAQVWHAEGVAGSLWNARQAFGRHAGKGRKPYFITAGATTRLGNAGFISAALELAAQVAAGVLPEPDRLFVAAGTGGTAAALVAGLKLAGLRTRVMAVRTADPLFANHFVITQYARDVLRYLRSLDASIPDIEIHEDDFDLLGEYLGTEYAAATGTGQAAVEWAAPQLQLETTYTGKALAACLDYCRGEGKAQTVLFWNTFNSRPFPKAPGPDKLPASMQYIFATS